MQQITGNALQIFLQPDEKIDNGLFFLINRDIMACSQTRSLVPSVVQATDQK